MTIVAAVVTIKNYVEMLKPHLCVYVGISAVFGHAMAVHRLGLDAVLTGFCVWILACGAAVLNNVQDRKYDGFFLRTSQRSLPRKKVAVIHARCLAAILIAAGLAGLLCAAGVRSFLWGIVAVAAYNGVYTPLKKRSLLAIFPGSLCGMLPPLIGWAAAGRTVTEPGILVIMAVLGVWQIPHFLILTLNTRPLFLQHPSLKGFPVFAQVFTRNEIKLQILIWTSLYSLGMLLFLVQFEMKQHLLVSIAGANALLVPFILLGILVTRQNVRVSIAFAVMNLSLLFFMGAGICDACFFQHLAAA